MTTTNIILDKATRDAQFTEYANLVAHIVREACRYEDGSMPPAHDELVDDGIFHAWRAWESICRRRPDLATKTRIRFAARDGARRAKRAAAKEHKLMNHAQVDELAYEEAPRGYRDPADDTQAEAIIAKLPAEYRPICRLFSYGQTKEMVAERRNISRSTLYNIIGELRILVSAELPEPKPVETETEPRRRFVPNREPVRAIDPDYEHNQCLTGAYVYADSNGNIVLADWTAQQEPVAAPTCEPVAEPAAVAASGMTVEDYLLSYAQDLWRLLIGQHGTVRALMVPE